MLFKKNVLMPEFAKNFQCIGGACEENCCKEWFISIDKATYKKYMNCPDLVFREKLKKYVIKSDRPEAYAQMLYGDETGYCAFLTEDGMCELQRNFGADYLSTTCKIYPRQFTSINDNFELALSSSCPEVARCFLDKKPMEFTYGDCEVLQHYTILISEKNYIDFNNIRDFIIYILQDRRYIFEMRLILVGLFIQKIVQNNFKNTQDTVASYKNMFRDTRIADQFFELPVMPDFQFDIITNLFKQKRFLTDQKRYEQLFNDTLRGLEFNEDRDTRQRLQSYIDKLVVYEESFLKWDHVFENYFVHNVFSRPKGISGMNPEEHETQVSVLWNEYLYMCIAYRMLKFHMIGINSLRGLNEEEVVYIFAFFHRAIFGHNEEILKLMLAWIKEKNYDTLAYMSLLIRT